MTDKALVQIPAVHNGVISKLYYAKGDIAKVHAPLFAMNVNGDTSVAPISISEQTAEQVVEVEAPLENSGDPHLDDFILPDIGEGIVECEIVEWLVEEGQHIVEDQAVCDVMTDKALVQIPAKYSGIVEKLYYAKGDVAQVHSPLFQMRLQSGASSSQVPAPTVIAASKSLELEKSAPVIKKAQSAIQTIINDKAVASPAVRRRAREMDLDIKCVPGSGKNGRIYKEDLARFIEEKTSITTPDNVTPRSIAMSENSSDHVEPIRGIKAVMAKLMTESVSTIPHFTYSDEIDLTQLIALRGDIKEEYKKQGIKVTMMPFFIKALSLAIKEYPVLNSKVNDDCTELKYFGDHNIGMAVDSKVGLLVPNIKQCQNKNIVDIAQEVSRLSDSARTGRVSPEDLKGGTITISNIGAIGGTIATPIINKPEVAIVALGKLQHLPRFDDQGNVVSRAIMQVSWSGDHRVIDGGTIARFNNLWKDYLENPSKMIMAMS
ncbi:2-oxoisovalerate dehydrogenase E2 component (dihydrolipoyl transacylase) [Pseudoalteromonas denitrificans DSM 6059]|uniref:Dihydrolipoamide acetyltransferase component of pyruvate dehydrogenase complex n=2 Tax=Pseudoalteromonas TaxID=53246 RepID=A0A1I1M3Y5_9GAMM|nr:2-oxoisovalerate dehydrogenase E2 component (dihydrolipoyl transacylase) [Pseudoalteromonas denitrificans DSM 6059]